MKPIYLDYLATSPLDPQVAKIIINYLEDQDFHEFGTSTAQHYYGKRAEAAINLAREQVARLINGQPAGLIWTSGATEANNLAIKGTALFYQRQGKHIITSQIEHKSVLECCRYLETQGFTVSYIKPNREGRIDPREIKNAIRQDTILISIMHANNEVGTIQDLASIAEITSKHGILFHVDAAQSVGKVPLDLQQLPLDLISLSAHKLYGPKGIGALYVRPRPAIHLIPQQHGGSQEEGRRAGTLPTHQIVGMGAAYALAYDRFDRDVHQQKTWIAQLWEGLKDLAPMQRNGSLPEHQLSNVLNISFGDLKHHHLLTHLLDKLAISQQSSCNIMAPNLGSYVLEAMDVEKSLIKNTLRLSVGRFTTNEEITEAIKHIRATVQRLRKTT